jgi:hypothetical protein
LDAGILPSGPLLFKFRDIHASRRVKLTVQWSVSIQTEWDRSIQSPGKVDLHHVCQNSRQGFNHLFFVRHFGLCWHRKAFLRKGWKSWRSNKLNETVDRSFEIASGEDDHSRRFPKWSALQLTLFQILHL